MDESQKYLLDYDHNAPPSPPVDVLHLHVKYVQNEGTRDPSQENFSEQDGTPSGTRLQDEREYTELEEETTEAESPEIPDEEQFTFVRYGYPYPAPKPRDIHLDFKHSEMVCFPL